MTIALFSAYFAYLPAEAIGVSGVLAAVTVGIYMGRLTSRLTTPTTRIQGIAVWEIVTFLLNSALFVLVGLQLPTVIDGISDLDDRRADPRRRPDRRDRDRRADRLRVPVHLPPAPALAPAARARAVPAEAAHADRRLDRDARRGLARGRPGTAARNRRRAPFPERELIIFCAFAVILATLLLQGLTLPPLIKWLGVDDYDEELEQEEVAARLRAIEAALARMDELVEEEWVLEDTVDRIRGAYRYRQRRFTALTRDGEFDGGIDGDGIDYETRSVAYQRVVREVLEAQRATADRAPRRRRDQRRRPAPDRARARPRGLAAGDLKPFRFDGPGCKPSFSRERSSCARRAHRQRCPHLGRPRWEIANVNSGPQHGEPVEKATRRGNYESGSDYVLEYGELRFSFNEQDFGQRVEQAAVKLDFVDGGLDSDELHDLLELAVNGEIREPTSPLGEHINEHWTELVGPANRSLVHWIRRLVFRGAWLDQRVKEGELDVVFDADSHSFGYVQPDRDSEPIELSREPSWSSLAYRR